jgi:tetratricopeptide (TPR) repeat protein
MSRSENIQQHPFDELNPPHRPNDPTRPANPPVSEATVLQENPVPGGPNAAWPTDLPDYHIVGELGKGGMGVVYKAVQLSLNRTVALKMLRAGLYASPELLVRFRMEAEALASLQHPNIVQVYEVGQHAGCPYMTMEFLEGGSLDELLKGQPQPPPTTAELVETLARAMHCAHLRGIIHRDLKPANVLLAASSLTSDAKPQAALVPKITDFGLAKRLEQSEGQTAPGIVMGTPSYMAPEQALGRSRDVGPAADVYALGAILYEMLTGRPPFQGDTQLETMRKVVSEEPVAPRTLQPKVPRDLTTICMKCLQKQAARRFTSAEALADDLHRYLNGEPIHARRARTAERAGKWMKRHPAGTALIGVIVLATIALLNLGIYSYREVSAERDQALKDYRVAFEAVDHLYNELANERLLDEPNKDPVREQLLARAPEVYRGLARQHSNDPEVQREIALASFRLADIHRILDKSDLAEFEYLEAIERQGALCRRYPEKVQLLRDLANSHNWLGELLRENQQRLREAEPHFHEAQRLQRRAESLLSDDAPAHRACLMELARSHYNLGIVQMDTGRPAGALSDYDRSVALLISLHQNRTDDVNSRQDLARALINRGLLHAENHRANEAAKDYHEAIEQLRWLRGRAPERVAYKYDLAIALQNRGYLETTQKQHDAARTTQQEALKILQELVADFSTRPRYRKKLANTLNSLGMALSGGGDTTAAEQCWRKACDLLEPLLEEVSEPADYQGILGFARGNLGWLEASRNHLPEARQLLERAIAHLQAAIVPGVQRADYQQALKNNARNLAEACVQLGDHASAVDAANILARGSPKLAQDFYNAACLIARSVVLAQQDSQLGDEQARRQSADRYADLAIRLLRDALVDPRGELVRIPDDTSFFRHLEGRPGFAAAMNELRAKTEKP